MAEAEHQMDDGHVVSGDDSLTNDWPRTGSVEFRNVTIRYDPQGPDILKDVNLTFAAGERVAIVGRTGSGKSTVCASPISREITTKALDSLFHLCYALPILYPGKSCTMGLILHA